MLPRIVKRHFDVMTTDELRATKADLEMQLNYIALSYTDAAVTKREEYDTRISYIIKLLRRRERGAK